jgi:L-fucose isomerase-like protein
MAAERTMTFGVVVGNRGFFPDHLAKTGREEIISVLQKAGAKAVVLGPEDSKYGAVETYAEAQKCADLFKKHAEEIDGIIVTLPNFGEERGIVDAIRLSGLKVPVLV